MSTNYDMNHVFFKHLVRTPPVTYEINGLAKETKTV